MNKAILFVIIAVVVVAGLYFVLSNKGVAPTIPGTLATAPAQEMTAGQSTPDAITVALLGQNSTNVFTPAEIDPTSVAVSDQTVASFDQTLNTSQF